MYKESSYYNSILQIEAYVKRKCNVFYIDYVLLKATLNIKIPTICVMRNRYYMYLHKFDQCLRLAKCPLRVNNVDCNVVYLCIKPKGTHYREGKVFIKYISQNIY